MLCIVGTRPASCAPYLSPQPTIIPTGNLIELEDEMYNLAASSPPRPQNYDIPRSSTMKATSQSSSQLGYPIPKPRHKLSSKAASTDAHVDDGKVEYPHLDHPDITSQYSQLNANFGDPTALVVTSHPDQYINHGTYYENLTYGTTSDWHTYGNKTALRHDSTGELVLQTGGRADAYARTSYIPRSSNIAENSGAAAMTSDESRNTLPPAAASTLSSEIRYPPPMINRLSCRLPAEQEEHHYDALRYVSHDKVRSYTMPSNSRQDGHSDSTPPSSPHVKRPTGQYAHLVDDVKGRLPQATDELCMQYLTKNKGDIDLTLQDMKVHILMDMGLENATIDSCRKALGHCQWKLDRAAEWLIEQSFS